MDKNSPVSTTTDRPARQSNGFWDLAKSIVILIIIIVPFRMYVAQPFIVNGSSMDNTFHQSDYLVVDELSYHFRTPERGEVIIFKNPNDTSQYFIKRVIGLPGETVITNGSQVSIISGNKKINLTEPYLGSGGDHSVSETLKTGEYFVMGDNRRVSYDSRSWGPLPADLIKGRAFLRLFPPQSISYLPGNYGFKN